MFLFLRPSCHVGVQFRVYEIRNMTRGCVLQSRYLLGYVHSAEHLTANILGHIQHCLHDTFTRQAMQA